MIPLPKLRHLDIPPGAPQGWPVGWDFPGINPPGWPRPARSDYSPTLLATKSPIGIRVRAYWHDVQGDGFDPFLGQFCLIRLRSGSRDISFKIPAKPLIYRGVLAEIHALEPELFGVDVLLQPDELDGLTAEVEVYGHEGTHVEARVIG
jgi:hypothetical protein